MSSAIPDPFPQAGDIFVHFSEQGEKDVTNIQLDVANEASFNFDRELVENPDKSRTDDIFFYHFLLEYGRPEDIELLFSLEEDEFIGATITLGDEEDKGHLEQSNGLLFYSNSPTTHQFYYISFHREKRRKDCLLKIPTDAIVDNIEDFLNFSLVKYLNYNIINSLTVLHVGEGHHSRFYNPDNEFINFDIGASRFYNQDISIKGQAFFNNKLRGVILSHWDLDHFLGVTMASKDELNPTCVPWIAPNKVKSYNAKRLVLYIYNNSGKQLCLVNFSLDKSISTQLRMFKCSGNTINDNGLGIHIKFNNGKSVLTIGDADYFFIPDDLYRNTYDYLIASHHGAEMQSQPPSGNPFSKAIIPVGYNPPHYGHPREMTIKGLINAEYLLHNTYMQGGINLH